MIALKKLRTSITLLSRRQPPMSKNSNDGAVNISQQQEIRPPSPTSAQHNNDYEESPEPTLEQNVYASSPPLVQSEDDGDLKEEDESEEHRLNNINDNESMSNESMGDILDGVYFSEEIQSILE